MRAGEFGPRQIPNEMACWAPGHSDAILTRTKELPGQLDGELK